MSLLRTAIGQVLDACSLKRYLDRRRGRGFPGSGAYWESRYREKGNSGCGSYGELADFKAEVLNAFVREHVVQTVIEFGCGDGNQLSLAQYPQYVGLDISKTAIRLCSQRFAVDHSKSFFCYDSECFVNRNGALSADLALSLDVIYHLVEDDVFDSYMQHLFGAARRYVIVYSSNADSIPGPCSSHVRHRRFSEWIEGHLVGWELINTMPNRYPCRHDGAGSFAEFYMYERK